MKNISAYEMNFEAEEMMERFVRGDESRTSEGHGLGLAIASSYTANMGGRMELAADGDLFKVILRFPEAGEDSAAGETATKPDLHKNETEAGLQQEGSAEGF